MAQNHLPADPDQPRPPGLESVLVYNGLKINERRLIDGIVLGEIDGLSDADLRDSREMIPQAHGETAYDAYFGGRSVSMTGIVRAGNIAMMRLLKQRINDATNDLIEHPLWFTKNGYRDGFRYDTLSLYNQVSGNGALGIKREGGLVCPTGTVDILEDVNARALGDSRAVLKFSLGGTPFAADDYKFGVYLKRASGSSLKRLFGYWIYENAAGTNRLRLYYNDGASDTSLTFRSVGLDPSDWYGVTSGPANLWLVLSITGNHVLLELWDKEPKPGELAYAEIAHDLTGAAATAVGAGVTGTGGIGPFVSVNDSDVSPDYADTIKEIGVEPLDQKTDVYLLSRKSGPVAGLERQVAPSKYERDVQIPFRASNPKFLGSGRSLDIAGPEGDLAFTTTGRTWDPLLADADDFSTDTITSGKWSVVTGAGTIAVSGGQLVPSTTAQKVAIFTGDQFIQDQARSCNGGKFSLKFVVPGSGSGVVDVGAVFCYQDTSNYDFVQVSGATIASVVVRYIQRRAGVDNVRATSGAVALTAGNTYWVRARMGQDASSAVYAVSEILSTDPALETTGATPTVVATVTLGTPGTYLPAPAGTFGWRMTPGSTGWRYDDMRADYTQFPFWRIGLATNKLPHAMNYGNTASPLSFLVRGGRGGGTGSNPFWTSFEAKTMEGGLALVLAIKGVETVGNVYADTIGGGEDGGGGIAPVFWPPLPIPVVNGSQLVKIDSRDHTVQVATYSAVVEGQLIGSYPYSEYGNAYAWLSSSSRWPSIMPGKNTIMYRGMGFAVGAAIRASSQDAWI